MKPQSIDRPGWLKSNAIWQKNGRQTAEESKVDKSMMEPSQSNDYVKKRCCIGKSDSKISVNWKP